MASCPLLSVRLRQKLLAGLLSPAWLALLGFATLMLARTIKVDAMIGAYTGCQHCILGSLLHHDLAMLGGLAMLLALDLVWPWLGMRYLLRLCALLLVLVYALDFAVFASLNQRLYLADVMSFGREGGALAGFIKALMQSPHMINWLAAAGLMLLASLGVLWPRRRNTPAAALLLAVAVLAIGLRALPVLKSNYVHPEIVDNVAEINLSNSADSSYSDRFKADLAAHPQQLPRTCAGNPDSDRPNVILVAVESLSAYHSRLLGGDMDALPQLDALARANHYFTHFIANGFNTSDGRIALYTGRVPLPSPVLARTRSLRAYGFVRNTLLSHARAGGYTTHYFTTGDLGFANSTPWLQTLKFDTIEGAEAPFYKGMKRWQFNAAEDQALFDRVLDWLDQRNDGRPFLAALLTVSSHPPFVNPKSGKINQLATFRYVDAQLARFYRKLKQRGFFQHGVLLITGDHRSMTPLHASEYQRWGERAFSRVPLVVIGDVQMPAVVRQTFAQTDVPDSFAWLAGEEVCLDAAHGNFARHDPQPADYVLHASGDRRDQVDVYFGNRHASVLLDGDNSRWLGDKPGNWRQILRNINIQRIQQAELVNGFSAPGRKSGRP